MDAVPGIIPVILFAFGALFASFTGVLAERVNTGQSWARGRSRCNSCRETLSARDLLPIASWILGKGRCRHCGSRLPATYLVAEATLGTLFVLGYFSLGMTLSLLLFLAFLVTLLFIVLYDLRHTVIPPLSSFLLFLFALGFALTTAPSLHLLGATILVASGISFFLFLLHVGSRGRAMGLGDAPVAFSLALMAGAGQAFTGFLFSFWIGALLGVIMLLRRRGGPTMGIEVPFAPFLATGFLLAYFTQWNPFPF